MTDDREVAPIAWLESRLSNRGPEFMRSLAKIGVHQKGKITVPLNLFISYKFDKHGKYYREESSPPPGLRRCSGYGLVMSRLRRPK